LKTDSAHQPISFDFEDSFFAPEASDVIITKHSPLRENRNIQNTLDHNTLKKHSSNLNTLKSKNETQLSPVREEFEQVFTKTSWKTTTDEDELEKLDQVRQIFESLKDNTLATFCREFGNNIQGSSLSKRDFRPKRTEAERLILKRWTDNYFH
jgi:DNA phosphorothioation-dependent restriction protein DptG